MTSTRHRRTASLWHSGQWSPLYAYASTGTVVPGLDREIEDCLDVVERGDLDLDLDLDQAVERERLLGLLHEVEPELARIKAREIGSDDGEQAAAWWEQDALGGRATGDTTSVAQQVLDGIEVGDPAVLDGLAASMPSYTRGDLEADTDWVEPDPDDVAAHVRWEAERPRLWDAYRDAYEDAFQQAVVAACRREVIDHTPAVSWRQQTGGVTEWHLAEARYQGGNAAATEALGLHMTEHEAAGVLTGRHHIEPPAIAADGAGHPTAVELASKILYRSLDEARPDHRDAVAAIAQAWELGRDIVWDPALRANALSTLSLTTDARSFERLYEGRVQMLAEAANPAASTPSAGPYLRPAAAEAGGSSEGRSVPPGWVVESVGAWEGVAHEVVYDPRRYDVAVIELPGDQRPMPASGWDLVEVDGSRGFCTLDRVAAARSRLARSEQLAMGTGAQAHGPDLPEPARGLAL